MEIVAVVALVILFLLAVIGCFGLMVLDDQDRRPYGLAVFGAVLGIWAVVRVAGPTLGALIHRWTS